MNEIRVQINSIEEMHRLANLITNFARPNQVIALNGDLGAGKTTFTKGIGQALEIKRVINSPTFTIMKIYDAVNKINGIQKLYHLDVYRLQNSEDDFELEEYFYLQGLTIIEWATIIEDILPSDTWNINIYRLTDTSRIVEFENVPKNLLEAIGEQYEIINR